MKYDNEYLPNCIKGEGVVLNTKRSLSCRIMKWFSCIPYFLANTSIIFEATTACEGIAQLLMTEVTFKKSMCFTFLIHPCFRFELIGEDRTKVGS